jgi:hypothetical protein
VGNGEPVPRLVILFVCFLLYSEGETEEDRTENEDETEDEDVDEDDNEDEVDDSQILFKKCVCKQCRYCLTKLTVPYILHEYPPPCRRAFLPTSCPSMCQCGHMM